MTNQDKHYNQKQIINNEAFDEYLKTFRKHGIEYQTVPPNMHCHNTAEKAISTFKHHFKAILAGVDSLIPQAESTLKMLRPTKLHQKY